MRNQGDEEYFKFISSKLPIISLANWENATSFMQSLLHNPQTLINHRNTMIQKWNTWKQEVKQRCFEICQIKA